MAIAAIAPGLLDEDKDGPVLIGGRNKQTGRIIFPMPQGVAGAGYEPVKLARQGKLWSWTVQRFRPKSPPYAGAYTPETFKPYAVGYVYLPALAGLIVTSVLTAPLGVKLAHSLPVGRLKRIFAVLLYLVGTRMLVSLF